MLMPSSRHTRDDQTHWLAQERTDRLNYSLRKVEAKAAKAKEALKEFIDQGACYLAVSFGKDSVVVAHLLWSAGRPWSDLPVYRVRMDGIETPGTDQVEQAFLQAFPLAGYRRIDSPHDPSHLRAEGKREQALASGIREACRLAGTSRYINGLRSQESSARRTRMKRGLAIAGSCSPIGWWKDADVFAYLAHHGLPVHQNYAMTLGGAFPREHLRVCMLGNHKGRAYGRLLWEKTYYREEMAAMKALHPNMVPEG